MEFWQHIDHELVNKMSVDIGYDAAAQLNCLSIETGLKLGYEIDDIYGSSRKRYKLHAVIDQKKLEIIQTGLDLKNLERTIRALRLFAPVLKKQKDSEVDKWYHEKQIEYLKSLRKTDPDVFKEITEEK